MDERIDNIKWSKRKVNHHYFHRYSLRFLKYHNHYPISFFLCRLFCFSSPVPISLSLFLSLFSISFPQWLLAFSRKNVNRRNESSGLNNFQWTFTTFKHITNFAFIKRGIKEPLYNLSVYVIYVFMKRTIPRIMPKKLWL